MSKFFGSLAKISAATSSNISSFDLPPPEVVRAYYIEHVMLLPQYDSGNSKVVTGS